ANVRAEQLSRQSKRERAWNVPWRSATRINDKGWTAELALPLFPLKELGDFSRARINLAINRVLPTIDPQGVGVGERHESYTWSPVVRTFHEPARFGAFRGLSDARPQGTFLVSASGVKVGAYYRKDKTYSYDVSGMLRSFTARGGKVILQMSDEPVAGKPTEVKTETHITGKQSVPFKLTVPVTSFVARKGRFSLIDPDTAEVLQTIRLSEMESLSLMSSYADRSYYTTEKSAVVTCLLGLPTDMLAGAALSVLDAAGNDLGKSTNVTPQTRVSANIATLAIGTHSLQVQLTGRDGQPLLSQALKIIRRKPKPGLEWKIDRIHRRLLLDGKPFFPWGIVMYAMVAGRDDAEFARMADLGFNSVQRWYHYAKPEKAMAYHEMAARHNLYVVDAIERYATSNIISQKFRPDFTQVIKDNLPRMETAIKNLKDSPRLMAYSGFDEPFANQIEAGRMLHAKIHELDGYHPKKVLYSSWIPKGDQFIDWCDILATDPYWVPGGSGERGQIGFVPLITHLTHQRGERHRKVTWIMPFAEYWSGIRRRALLPKEQFAQTWLALIHGAKGLFYFRYPFSHQMTMDAFRELGKQMQVLGPIVVTDEIDQQVTYSPTELRPEERKFPDVHVSLHRRPEGGCVLLAANSRAWPVDVTIRIPAIKSGEAGRLFSQNKLRVKDSTFSARLKALDTRAYTLDASLDQPVLIEVHAKSHPAKTDPLYGPGHPDTGRPGKKNIARNPGFEEASLPGWPDYFLIDQGGPRLGVPGQQADWGQDSVDPYEGKFSLRIKGFTRNRRRIVRSILCPQADKPRQYILSAWMRSDEEGAKVKFIGGGYRIKTPTFGHKTFTLTTQWRRYYEVGTIPANVGRYHSIGLELLKGTTATVWLDAIQLEEGAEPKVFDP
ncbi:MAG: hypothetical protein QF473_12165, partial [Planctomycetota bacterium]|nr:hypothetical protein [Planctomycetota bacterium]